MSVPLQRQQYSLVGNMSQIMMDLLSSLTNCIYCFPGSPSLKVNNRSFKMQHLLGEVSSELHSDEPGPGSPSSAAPLLQSPQLTITPLLTLSM